MTNTNVKSRKNSNFTEVAARQEDPGRPILQYILFAAAPLLITAILGFELPKGLGSNEFMTGDPAPRTFFSPIELSYVNEDATAVIKSQAGASVPRVFMLSDEINRGVMKRSGDFFDKLKDLRKKADAVPAPSASDLPIMLSESSFRLLMTVEKPEEIRKQVSGLLTRHVFSGTANAALKRELLEQGTSEIVIRTSDGKERSSFVHELPELENLRRDADNSVPRTRSRDEREMLLDIMTSLAAVNLAEDTAETESRRKKAAAAVLPVEDQVRKDELIVQRGMLITPEARTRLDQIRKKLAEHEAFNKLLATGGLTYGIYGLALIYLIVLERRVFRTAKLVVLIHLALGLAALLAKVMAVWPASSFYLMPSALASVLLTLLISPRLGIMAAMMSAGFAGPIAEFVPEAILMALFSSLAGTFASLRIRKRGEFLRMGAAVGLASFLVLFFYRIYQEYPLLESFQISALGLANGLLITMPICFLLLPLLEHAFDLTTDITLLELSDLNHPLLKRMIVEAPGTYHHSLVVSTLAEAACEAIGANALLARVGCYFHDIGKIARAEFFTENNRHGNRHEKLTPAMSCLVIQSHVKDGIELGRKFKLREPILRFIPEHQGTGVVYYFYRRAVEQAAPGEKINPDDYRYPGPSPQSRETAVAMLSDSTEAASRSLREPSPESIRQLVRKIINDKFVDGQLDECDLTLRDLNKIQDVFVRNLMAIFHTRVKYPDIQHRPDQPRLFEEVQFDKFRMNDPQRKKEPGEPEKDAGA